MTHAVHFFYILTPSRGPCPPTYLWCVASPSAHHSVWPHVLTKEERWAERASPCTLALLVQHLSERTRLLPLLLLLLKLMETGREIFCFSNPGFCQANTRIVLKMAAVEESVSGWSEQYPTPPSSRNSAHAHTLRPLQLGEAGYFLLMQIKC